MSTRLAPVGHLAVALLCILVAGSGCGSSDEPPTNSGDVKPVIARVYFQSRDNLAELAADIDVWEVHDPEGYLVAYVTREQIDRLSARGFLVEIDPEFTARVNRPREVSPGRATGIPGFPCYRTVEETFTSLHDMASGSPALATLTDSGDSWNKATGASSPGYDIWELTLTNGAIAGPKPRFLLSAETHPREYVTAEAATRFAEHVLANYSADPEVTWLLDLFELHLIAMVNPDGRKIAEQGEQWRKNTDSDECAPSRHGVDLNRNYDFKWGGAGSSPDPCSESYRGRAPASEPETRAFQAYLASLFPDRRGSGDADPAPSDYEGLYVTLHSYGSRILWPWSWGNALAPNATQLRTLGRKLAFFNGYSPMQGVSLYPAAGTEDDYAYGILGVPAYTFEMGANLFEGCDYFESTVWPRNRDALLWAFKSARRPYENPAGPDSVKLKLTPDSATPGAIVTLTATADDTRYKDWTQEPTGKIAAARYSIDAPSWMNGATTYAMAAADGSFNSSAENLIAAIDTTGLAPGRHLVFAESEDAQGNWGVTTAVFLTITGPG